MNQKIEKPTRTNYFIAHGGGDLPYHCGVVYKDNAMETKYDNIETFTRKTDFVKRCKELEIDTTEIFDS